MPAYGPSSHGSVSPATPESPTDPGSCGAHNLLRSPVWWVSIAIGSLTSPPSRRHGRLRTAPGRTDATGAGRPIVVLDPFHGHAIAVRKGPFAPRAADPQGPDHLAQCGGQHGPLESTYHADVRSSPPPVRLAVVGCGAVTESLHLPAFARAGRRPALLVDHDLPRAEALAERFGVAHVARDPAECIGVVDAAIVAVPIPHHAAVGETLLAGGVDVLMEKPLAATTHECDRLIAAARAHGRILMVGLMRRFLRMNRWLKAVVATGQLGRIHSFDIREGYRFEWPVTSMSFFSPAAGGVLKDLGSHTLDLARWLFGEIEIISYRDNAFGGVETDCVVDLVAGGIPGVAEYSRGRSLRNSFVIHGERATVEAHHFGQWARIRPGSAGIRPPLSLHRHPRRWQTLLDLFVAEHAHFLDVVGSRTACQVPPEDGRAIVAAMEACSARRLPLELPWLTEGVTTL